MRYGVMVTVMILAYVNVGMAQVSPIQRESLRYLPGVTLAIEEIEADSLKRQFTALSNALCKPAA